MTANLPADNLPALLKAATGSADRHRQAIEPHLAARELAAAKVTALASGLVTAWRDLVRESDLLTIALREAGIENVPKTHIEITSLAGAVASELWRLGNGPFPGSPLALPCACSGEVSRPDMLAPLCQTIREANTLVRGLLP